MATPIDLLRHFTEEEPPALAITADGEGLVLAWTRQGVTAFLWDDRRGHHDSVLAAVFLHGPEDRRADQREWCRLCGYEAEERRPGEPDGHLEKVKAAREAAGRAERAEFDAAMDAALADRPEGRKAFDAMAEELDAMAKEANRVIGRLLGDKGGEGA